MPSPGPGPSSHSFYSRVPTAGTTEAPASINNINSSSSGFPHKNPNKNIFFQIRLLLWKRKIELLSNRTELFKYVGPPILFFLMLILIYALFGEMFYDGGIEDYFVPIGFWLFVQKNVVSIMYEKSSRLQESMRMMGLFDAAYWSSYFISDGIVLGFFISLACSIVSTYGLFNHGNFFAIFGLLFLFCVSIVPFGFFICSFFDTPQTSGQITIALLLGFYVIYLASGLSTEEPSVQAAMSLFPPLALQLGCASFRKSYVYDNKFSTGNICGMMIVDAIIYSILAWYFSQVWPSEIGVRKPFYFPFTKSYWFPSLEDHHVARSGHDLEQTILIADETPEKTIPFEVVNEDSFGTPTGRVLSLSKSFGDQRVVNKLKIDLYQNQIFVLLGHNGAGKTTAVNMLTGLLPPDSNGGDALIYGRSIKTEMDHIRQLLGVCPQHDVLFENLTVEEHILFFSQLKGSSFKKAQAEAKSLAAQFHLEERLNHKGSELSGGQKRKLSVSIAICGGSKFIVLDEPTAGMDPLARRELWDLLSDLRVGRTMLLITHYMDEADILGDRVGIMTLGNVQCIGSPQFLKTIYGAGYQLIFDHAIDMPKNGIDALISFVESNVPKSKYLVDQSTNTHSVFVLPFGSVFSFGNFFTMLQNRLEELKVSNYGVTITSLEDVFLKVGEDHTVTPHSQFARGIGSARVYHSNFISQVIGIAKRKLSYAMNDFVTLPLLGLPIIVAIVAAALYAKKTISKDEILNDIVSSEMYVAGFLGASGLIAEFLVRERVDRLRNVLTVMGCDFKAYWVGSLIADFILLLPIFLVMLLSWICAGMEEFYTGKGALTILIIPLFLFQLICFSYLCSYMFTSPKSCIAFMPMIIILLLLLPTITIMLIILVFDNGLHMFSLSSNAIFGILLWGVMLLCPHGALVSALLDTIQDFSEYISVYPPVYATLPIMLAESLLFLYIAYAIDRASVRSIEQQIDPHFDDSVLSRLDEDVLNERDEVVQAAALKLPLRINRLRKVFLPKHHGGKKVVAAEDVSFCVQQGELFGLLGANGAGKTTILSMLTRHLLPTAGNAYIMSYSILDSFSQAATHLGVVTQNNSLWEKLSVEDHLYLFARLRGIPEEVVTNIVDTTIDQLELTPHKKKLAGRLSGGMKRKLCVAIALIGDPEVVLLDEPSAGLDPVSRRNLWNVILKTMSHRAVVLTTHSMEEAEALCRRIGIMVLGQLRAIGTKQHLKTKLGSGYELVAKLKTVDHRAAFATLDNFVHSIFPAAKFLSDNGGLITFQIPKDTMNMGLIFSALEEHKERLCIENYSVAQPTLEQVFIRTVQENTPLSDSNSLQRMRDSMTQLLGDDEHPEAAISADEIYVALNSCGCTPRFILINLLVFCALFFLFFGLAFALGKSALFAFGVIFFIITLICCCIYCCPCLQPPKGIDE